jgi:chemotaxis-related protein WspD
MESGRGLLDRASPENYLREWTELLAQAKETAPSDMVSLIVFRVGSEWFGLNTAVFQRIAPLKDIHRIPHRSGRVLLGLANVDGELLLCASLAGLLMLETPASPPPADEDLSARLIVVGVGERWAFPVDEVDAIHHVSLASMSTPPATLKKSTQSFTKSMFEMNGHIVAWLDEKLVLEALKKSVNP